MSAPFPPPRALPAALATQSARIASRPLASVEDRTLDLIAFTNTLADESADLAIQMLVMAAIVIADTEGVHPDRLRDNFLRSLAQQLS